MQATVGLILIVLGPYSSLANIVSKQEIDWNNYGYDEILRDSKSFINQSEINLLELTLKRYPGVISIFKDILSQITANGSFKEDMFCDKIGLAIKGLNDSCRRSTEDIFKDINLTKACNESVYAASLTDQKFSRLCTTKHSIPNTNGTNGTVLFQSGSFFHAIKLFRGTAAVATKRRCTELGGIFDEQAFLCVKNGTAIKIYPLKDESLRTTIVVGNCFSFAALVVLLVTYIRLKKYNTLAGKNIIFLSAALIVAHFLQIILEYLFDIKWVCRAGAIMLHFSLLLAFSWMAIIAFEFYHTFSKVRPVDQYQRRKRFQKYILLSFTFSAIILLICLMVDISEERYSGYGLNGKCFVSKFWANLFGFVTPVTIVLISNAILLSLTIWSLHKTKRDTEKSLKSRAKTAAKKREMVLSIMTLKLSILLGFGWIFGFIEASYENIALKYIYSIVISLQGLLVFLAFGCHKECMDLIKKRSTVTGTQTATYEMNTV